MSLEHQNKADGQCRVKGRGILRGGGDNASLVKCNSKRPNGASQQRSFWKKVSFDIVTSQVRELADTDFASVQNFVKLGLYLKK